MTVIGIWTGGISRGHSAVRSAGEMNVPARAGFIPTTLA